MKNLLLSLALSSILSISCSSSKKINEKTACNENLIFKKEFFKNVHNVDSLLTIEQNRSFFESLEFISKYSYVNFDDVKNYTYVYSIVQYNEDRNKWLEWYEANKCNNIQFK